MPTNPNALLVEVNALAERCVDAGDQAVTDDFIKRFGVAPNAFTALDESQQQALLAQVSEVSSKDHPDAFFDDQCQLFDWETGEPMPLGWTGFAKFGDTLFVVGRDGGETSYTALFAKTMVDARKEAAARNLQEAQGAMQKDAINATKRYALASQATEAGLVWSVGGVWSASLIDQVPDLMTGPEVDAFHKKHPNAQVVDVLVYLEAHKAYIAGVNSVLGPNERSTPESRLAARDAGIKSLVRAGFAADALEVGRNETHGQGKVSNKPTVEYVSAEEFAKTHSCDADWIAAMGDKKVPVLLEGLEGTVSGHEATVLRHYSNGMYEVRTAGGVSCISASDFKFEQGNVSSYQDHGSLPQEKVGNWNEAQAIDTQPGNYYVTAQDAGKTYPMAGPFVNDHSAALAAVRAVKDEACNLDGRASFMSWGTTRCGESYTKPGPLNHIAGLALVNDPVLGDDDSPSPGM